MKNMMKNGKKLESVGEILRYWRQLKKISQMDLALDVDISSKHLSFVETGKSKPSRDLVLKIAYSLNLPYRHRNAFLLAAGYAPEFQEEPFVGSKMGIVRDAIQRLIENHEPYPAFVVNTGYKILMKNSGYDRFVSFYAGDTALKKYDNAIRILFAEDGLKPYVRDWPLIEQFILVRLWDEVVSTQNNELLKLYKEISLLRSKEEIVDLDFNGSLPVMSLILEKDFKQVKFFTMITTLGTPLDVATQELRIELLFPSDEETKDLFPL